MRISRFFPGRATRAFVVAAAVVGTLLLGGMANAASPAGPLQIINSMAPTVTTTPRVSCTTTTLTVPPPSSVPQGTRVTLNAAVTPARAAGTVQFRDGTTNLGTPVMLRNGAASVATSQLAVGSRLLTAVFTPSDPEAFCASTSPAVSVTVTAPQTGTPPAAGTTTTPAAGTTTPPAAGTTTTPAAGTTTPPAAGTTTTPAAGTTTTPAQPSGQSLDGGGLIDLDLNLNLGGGTDNRGSTLPDPGGATDNGGLIDLDLNLNLGGGTDSRAPAVLDGSGMTVPRSDDGDGGLLNELLGGLL